MTTSRAFYISLAIAIVLLAWSGWYPYDRTTWLMEVAPALIVYPLLWFTRSRFPLTTMLYGLILIHAAILMLGGAYTYARVPLGFTLQDILHLGRNPYDKIGHFAQGFIPALATREILLRGGHVKPGRILGFLCICVVMCVSASYELIEWGAAVALGQGADEFLGTQGDPWDTQSDMLFALIGGTVAILGFSRLHDRAMRRITADPAGN
ncbi:DUF2238 domain-containing protein [Burkholderiaceae bacterium DAT-1]|nr:DUF2238 domain-containing protein [Burkholderiaceae bacterium DAT-1]